MGYTKLDAMSPFPVHGIDDAIGIPYSKLGWIVVTAAIVGLITAQVLQYYVGVINYPLVIGGKPLFDFTFSIPVTFELTVLFSSITAVVGMLALNGLPRMYHPSMNYKRSHLATDDRFLLVIEANDPQFDAQKSAAICAAWVRRKWRWWRDEKRTGGQGPGASGQLSIIAAAVVGTRGLWRTTQSSAPGVAGYARAGKVQAAGPNERSYSPTTIVMPAHSGRNRGAAGTCPRTRRTSPAWRARISPARIRSR
jgi:hypothetical protein